MDGEAVSRLGPLERGAGRRCLGDGVEDISLPPPTAVFISSSSPSPSQGSLPGHDLGSLMARKKRDFKRVSAKNAQHIISDCLTGAMAAFIVSHKVSTSERYYIARNVKYNLADKLYKNLVSEEKPLFDFLGQFSMKRDPEAPIYATAEQMLSIEGRRDVTLLRQHIETAKREVATAAADDDESRTKAKAALTKHQAALRKLLPGLADLLVIQARKEYFPEAGRLRARDESTDHLRSLDQRRCGPHSEMDVEGLVRLFTCADDPSTLLHDHRLVFDGEAEVRSQRVMQWLLDYTAGRGKKVSPRKDQAQNPPTPPFLPRSTCFLCSTESNPVTFSRRPELTRHWKGQHVAKGTFDLPFSCPECDRLGNEKYIVFGALEWSNHTEQVHDKLHSPLLITAPSTRKLPARPVARRKRASEAKQDEPLPGMSVFDSLEEPEQKKICRSRSSTGSPICQSSPCLDPSLADPLPTATESMETYQLCHVFDEHQYAACPDLVTDSGSEISDDTTSHASLSLDCPNQSADRDTLTVSPQPTWLVKPAFEPQEMGSTRICAVQPTHQDWQLDFDFADVDEEELFCSEV